jgi:two-component system sensor histidine kinase RpfC
MELLRRLTDPELRCNPEYQSALVRLGIWLFSVLYIGLGSATGYYRVDHLYYLALFGAFLVLFLALLISVPIRPVWPARQFVSLGIDIAATSLAIFLTREAISPFYLVYIWIFISYGTRYGETHLKVASMLSVLAYNTVLLALEEWSRHTFEAVFFLLLLGVLPLYQYSLLRKVHEARMEAERANRAKGDFLATITHELRTPLSGVIGMSRLLRDSDLSEEQRDHAQSISASARVLMALIGDVLDLSKVEAGKLALEVAPFDLREVVLEVCAACTREALDKGLDMVCIVDARLPDEVRGDALRLRQILYNLVGNAIKFTESGQVVISARLETVAGPEGRPDVCLEVRDTGIGIPPNKLDQVFESFWQADVSTSRRFGGTGLGTAIVRELTRLMGGRIGVTSKEGEGSAFRVLLPLLPVDFRPVPAPDAPPKSHRALLYEPNAASRAVIADTCAGMGIECVPILRPHPSLDAGSGENPVPDLAIISDSPGGEDLAAVRERLRRRFPPSFGILLLTYGARRMQVATANELQLNKPFLPHQLRDRIDRLLNARPAAKLAVPETQRAAPLPRGAGMDILVAEDNAIAAKVIVAHLTRAGHRVTLTPDGRDALRRARERCFDLALVDLRMPHIDGLEFVRAFRAEEAPGRRLPVVALTADAEPEVQAEALRAGMDAFLAKPVEPESLGALLDRLADRPVVGSPAPQAEESFPLQPRLS